MRTLVFVLAASLPASAAAASPEREDSIHLSPLKMLAGNRLGAAGAAITYEHRFDDGHAVVFDAGVGWARDLKEDDDTTGVRETHARLAVGYRWHWRRDRDGGFGGVMVHQVIGRGNVTLADDTVHEVDLRSTQLTGHVGSRWALGWGFRATVRGGLGWGPYAVNARDDARDTEELLHAFLTRVPVAIDAELSVGYAF